MAYFQQNQQQPQGGPSQPSPFAQQSSFYASSTAPNPNTQSFSGPQFGGGSTSGWSGASGSPAGGAGGYGQFGGGGGGYAGGGGGGGQSQFGGGTQGVGGSGGMPANFGDKAKRNYLPGYLSSGGAMGQSEATPPHNGGDESRSWDSPTRRTSISGSPVSRFGNQSLFGSTRDGTPSRSPKASYAREPRAQIYRTEMEEDAPPTSSLTESPSSDSLTDFPAPAPSPLPSTSPLPSHPTPSPAGYAIHLFGFPSTSLSLVLSHFAQFGDITETTPSPTGGNWVTITYAQPWSAARAARRNGEILGGVLMIGVKIVDEDSLRNGLGPEQPAETKVAAPPRAQTSGVGKPVSLGSGSAFRPAAPTPPRRGFFGSGEPVAEGADPRASLFAEKNRMAVGAQGQGQKGVLGKVSDMVFGW